MMKIRYIGKRETYIEGCYGSQIEFKKGESKQVSDELGKKLLNHPDQYELDTDLGKAPEAVEAKKPAEKELSEDEIQTLRDSLRTMTKQGLVDFAKTNFAGVELSKSKTLDELRQDVTMLIDQYGAA